jgi:ADP-heptose:LPS heptosyltransferase
VKPHVLVARLDNAGDVLLAGPAIRAVAATSRRVTMLCGPRGETAAGLLPGVDDIVVYDAPWVAFDPKPLEAEETLALVNELGALELDQAIIFTSFHQSPLPLALLLRLAGVPFVAATSVDYPGSLLDIRHRISDDVHEVERALDLVESAGYRLPPGDDGNLAVERTGERPPQLGDWSFVVVHPGASVPARPGHRSGTPHWSMRSWPKEDEPFSPAVPTRGNSRPEWRVRPVRKYSISADS